MYQNPRKGISISVQGGKQQMNSPIAHLQQADTQNTPKIFGGKENDVSHPVHAGLSEQYQLRPVQGDDQCS